MDQATVSCYMKSCRHKAAQLQLLNKVAIAFAVSCCFVENYTCYVQLEIRLWSVCLAVLYIDNCGGTVVLLLYVLQSSNK